MEAPEDSGGSEKSPRAEPQGSPKCRVRQMERNSEGTRAGPWATCV